MPGDQPDTTASPDRRVRVFSQGQGAWEDRRQIASILGLPERAVRVTQVATGGAFGGKEDLGVQGQPRCWRCAPAGRSSLALSRRESLRFHPKRHPFSMTYTVGCDADGRLVAVRARIVGDTGAYASVGAKVLERAAGHACGAYRVPNVDVEALAVYTNNPPCGAMRGFGVPQVTFAIEGLLDVLAERVGHRRLGDPLAQRARRRATGLRTGQRLGPGVGLKRDAAGGPRRVPRRPATPGSPAGMKNTGIGNGVTETRPGDPPAGGGRDAHAVPLVDRDGAGDPHRAPPDRVRGAGHRRPSGSASSSTPSVELDTGETTASRATMLGGTAVLDAARRLREALAAAPSGASTSCRARVRRASSSSTGRPRPRRRRASPSPTSPTAGRRRSSSSTTTGRVERVVAAQDVGRAINPRILEGQMRGRRPHGPRLRPDRSRIDRRGRRAGDRDRQVARDHPGRRHAAGRDAS